MRKITISNILFLSLVWCFTGCAILNPYESEFQCPNIDKGECTSIHDAYEKSLVSGQDKVEGESGLERKDGCSDCVKDKETVAATGEKAKKTTGDISYDYQKSLYNKMISLIRDSRSPMVATPDVMRVLIMSYTGSENILYSYRYVYVFVTEPKWIYSTTQIERED